ncbi:MAG: hypothetical protein A2Z18_01030 [Armatimonadetes bacterium RBG_16_58_9]|nr:MAG: hypothetical protein A2Z18_01030 [Armatimonadetes bacterium RBG_16_58_9]
MRCSKSRRLIPKYIDSELGDTQAQELRNHISVCAACAQEEAQAKAMLDLLDRWPVVQPVLGYEALLSRMEHSDERVRGQASRHMSFPRRREPSEDMSFPRRRESRSFGVPSWAAAALATISIGAGMIAGMVTQPETPVEVPSEQQVSTAIGLGSFDDVLGASLLYGVAETANAEEGESL